MIKTELTGIKQFSISDSAIPVIVNEDDVLLKVDTVGVCGSDIHYYNEGRIGDQVIKFPFTIGHECSAWVVKTGSKVQNLKEGDLVAVEPALSCHQCEQCLAGREHTCLNQKFLGCPGQIDGCLAEYIIMPEKNCFKVPANIDGEMAALVEPLSIGHYAASFIKDISSIKSAAILGAGPIGISVMLSLHVRDFKNIYVTDKLDYRVKFAEKSGAKTSINVLKTDILKVIPNNMDVVFECCGQQDALDQAVDLLNPGGTLIVVGIPSVDRISFDISKVRRKEITIQNVRRQNNSIQPVIDLTAAGKWNAMRMVTHRFSPDKTAEGFKIVSEYRDEVIKALIKF